MHAIRSPSPSPSPSRRSSSHHHHTSSLSATLTVAPPIVSNQRTLSSTIAHSSILDDLSSRLSQTINTSRTSSFASPPARTDRPPSIIESSRPIVPVLSFTSPSRLGATRLDDDANGASSGRMSSARVRDAKVSARNQSRLGGTASSSSVVSAASSPMRAPMPSPSPPSAVLPASFAIGAVCSLSRHVGLVLYVGPVAGLSGTWVALAAYRSHRMGRRPVFDFDTVKWQQFDGKDKIETNASSSAAISSSSSYTNGVVGSDNYDTLPLPCEVDFASLVRAQREAYRLVGGGTVGDHTIFVRIEEPIIVPVMLTPPPATLRKRSVTLSTSSSASSHSTPMHAHHTSIQRFSSRDNMPSLQLFPAISSSTSSSAMVSVANSPRSNQQQLLTQMAAASSASSRRLKVSMPPPSPAPAPTLIRDASVTSREQKEEETMNATMLSTSASMTTALSMMSSSSLSAPSHIASSSSSSDDFASFTSPRKIRRSTQPSSRDPYAPSRSPSSSPSGSSRSSSSGLALLSSFESESDLPALACRLHLSGPYALVDAIALSAPPSCSASVEELCAFLTQRYPHTTCNDRAKARAIFKWICENIAMARSPLCRRVPEPSAAANSNSAGGEKDSKDATGRSQSRTNMRSTSVPTPDGGDSAHMYASFAADANSHLFASPSSAAASYSAASYAAASTASAGGTRLTTPFDDSDHSSSRRRDVSKPKEKVSVRDLGLGPAHRYGASPSSTSSASARLASPRANPATSTSTALNSSPQAQASPAAGKREEVHRARLHSRLHAAGRIVHDGRSGGGLLAEFGTGMQHGYSSEDDDDDAEHQVDADHRSTPRPYADAYSSYSAPRFGPLPAPLGLASSHPDSCSSVLALRLAGSSLGFASLFQVLATLAGLECRIVSGMVKLGPAARRRNQLEHAGKRAGTGISSVDESPAPSERMYHPSASGMSLNRWTSSSDLSAPAMVFAEWNIVRCSSGSGGSGSGSGGAGSGNEAKWLLVDCAHSSGTWDVNGQDVRSVNHTIVHEMIANYALAQSAAGSTALPSTNPSFSTSISSLSSASTSAPASDTGGCFVKQFSNCYFAPLPSQFVRTHFPMSIDGQVAATLSLSSSSSASSSSSSLASAPSSAASSAEQQFSPGHHLYRPPCEPLRMSALELLHSPSALQFVQPSLTLREWLAMASVSRAFIGHNLDSFESEYEISYGMINDSGTSNAGATFTLELEGPVWMTCAVEMVRLVPELLEVASGEASEDHPTTSVSASASAKDRPIGSRIASVLIPTKPVSMIASSSASLAAPAIVTSVPTPSVLAGLAVLSRRASILMNMAAISLGPSVSSAVATPSIFSPSPGPSGSSAGTPSFLPSTMTSPTTPASSATPPPSLPPAPPQAPYDLSTCWLASSTCTPRLETRQQPQQQLDDDAADERLRTSSVQHRKRTRIQLVFPSMGKYRVIIYSKDTEKSGHNASMSATSSLSSMSSSYHSASRPISASAHPAGSAHPSSIGIAVDDMSTWTSLVEYAITATQGVADLPPRKLAPVLAAIGSKTASTVVAATPAGNRSTVTSPNNLFGLLSDDSDAASASSHTTPSASPLPALPPAPPARHLFVGFLQPHAATFLHPAARLVASQIHALQGCALGYFELNSGLTLQYVTPRSVEGMVVVTDGLWAKFHAGTMGTSRRARFQNVQSDLLATLERHGYVPPPSSNAPQIEFNPFSSSPSSPRSESPNTAGNGQYQWLHHSHSSGSSTPGRDAHNSHTIALQQEPRIFTIDWGMLMVPELYVYFKYQGAYHLLSHFLPRESNYVRDAEANAAKDKRRGEEEKRRGAGEKNKMNATKTPMESNQLMSPTSSSSFARSSLSILSSYLPPPPPSPYSRLFLSPSGLAFTYSLHPHSLVVTSSLAVVRLDCSRMVDLKVRLVEGWVAGRAAPPTDREAEIREGDERGTGAGAIMMDGIKIEEDMTNDNRVTMTSSSKVNSAASMSQPLRLRARASIISTTRPLDSSSSSTSPLPPSSSSSSFPALLVPTYPDPSLHRFSISAPIPAPDAIQNASSTKYFTIIIYAAKKDEPTNGDDDQYDEEKEKGEHDEQGDNDYDDNGTRRVIQSTSMIRTADRRSSIMTPSSSSSPSPSHDDRDVARRVRHSPSTTAASKVYRFVMSYHIFADG